MGSGSRSAFSSLFWVSFMLVTRLCLYTCLWTLCSCSLFQAQYFYLLDIPFLFLKWLLVPHLILFIVSPFIGLRFCRHFKLVFPQWSNVLSKLSQSMVYTALLCNHLHSLHQCDVSLEIFSTTLSSPIDVHISIQVFQWCRFAQDYKLILLFNLILFINFHVI